MGLENDKGAAVFQKHGGCCGINKTDGIRLLGKLPSKGTYNSIETRAGITQLMHFLNRVLEESQELKL